MSDPFADDAPVAAFSGLGPKSSGWLAAVGLETAGDLRAAGAAVAYLRVGESGVRTSRVLLWALHGALSGKPWTEVTPAEKRRLEAEVERHRG